MYFASCSLILSDPRVLIISFSADPAGVFDVVVTSTTTSSIVFSSLKLGMITEPSTPSSKPVRVPYKLNMILLIEYILSIILKFSKLPSTSMLVPIHRRK